MDEGRFDYEVALSFAGEDRRYVARVAEKLRSRAVRTFSAPRWGRSALVGVGSPLVGIGLPLVGADLPLGVIELPRGVIDLSPGVIDLPRGVVGPPFSVDGPPPPD